MSESNCPHCGAEKDGDDYCLTHFKCDSINFKLSFDGESPKFCRDKKCYESELAAAKEQLATVTAELVRVTEQRDALVNCNDETKKRKREVKERPEKQIESLKHSINLIHEEACAGYREGCHACQEVSLLADEALKGDL